MKLPLPENSSVAVIGCGGLGNNILAHLAGSGVGTVFFCDYDTVEQGNLDRQFLYSQSDVGREKAECMADFFARYAPEIRAFPIRKRIKTRSDLAFAKNCDLIILAVDNNAVRRIAQAFCEINGIPLLNAGVDAFFGAVYFYIPGKSPCLDCAGMLSGETKDVVSVSSTVGLIGALSAEIAVRYLLEKDHGEAGILHIYDQYEIKKLKIIASPDCGVCNRIKEWNRNG